MTIVRPERLSSKTLAGWRSGESVVSRTDRDYRTGIRQGVEGSENGAIHRGLRPHQSNTGLR